MVPVPFAAKRKQGTHNIFPCLRLRAQGAWLRATTLRLCLTSGGNRGEGGSRLPRRKVELLAGAADEVSGRIAEERQMTDNSNRLRHHLPFRR